MKHASFLVLGATCLLLCIPPASAQTRPAPIDQPIKTLPAFRIETAPSRTSPVLLSSFAAAKKSVILVFVANRCGVTWLYADKIAGLQKQYGASGKVAVIGVHSNFDESDTELIDELKRRNIPLTVIDDKPKQTLADYFGATVTPYFVVIDANGILRYKGPFDKMGGSVAEDKRVQYLRPALNAITAGKPVAQKTVRALGCEITRRSKP